MGRNAWIASNARRFLEGSELGFSLPTRNTSPPISMGSSCSSARVPEQVASHLVQSHQPEVEKRLEAPVMGDGLLPTPPAEKRLQVCLIRCFRYLGLGHLRRHCRRRIRCFLCKKLGHMRGECSRRVIGDTGATVIGHSPVGVRPSSHTLGVTICEGEVETLFVAHLVMGDRTFEGEMREKLRIDKRQPSVIKLWDRWKKNQVGQAGLINGHHHNEGHRYSEGNLHPSETHQGEVSVDTGGSQAMETVAPGISMSTLRARLMMRLTAIRSDKAEETTVDSESESDEQRRSQEDSPTQQVVRKAAFGGFSRGFLGRDADAEMGSIRAADSGVRCSARLRQRQPI